MFGLFTNICKICLDAPIYPLMSNRQIYYRCLWYHDGFGPELTYYFDHFLYDFHEINIEVFSKFISFFSYFVILFILFVVLLAVYKKNWWNVVGYKKFILVILLGLVVIFYMLFKLRCFLYYMDGADYGLVRPVGAEGVLYPFVSEHFLFTPFIVDIQLFIIFIFFFVLLLLYFQIIDDFNINFGTPIVMLFCVLGSCLLLIVRDFFTLYLFLELQSLSVYVLVCIRKTSHISSEISLKYFIFGSFASCMLLYGISLIMVL